MINILFVESNKVITITNSAKKIYTIKKKDVCPCVWAG